MDPVIIFCSETSSRLSYVLDWIFNEQLKTGYKLIDNSTEAETYPFIISYGSILKNALSIPRVPLLAQKGITEQTIATAEWNYIPVLYAVDSSGYTLNFDLFSAIFFLLSRYEEYYTYTADKHNRYPATESILFKTGNLERPLVDEWLYQFRQLLIDKFQQTIPGTAFSFVATYDIDIAYSYYYKGLKRTLGGYVRDILTGNMQQVKERTACLIGEKDPYDSFDWLTDLHTRYNIKPIYFILAALYDSAYDKNIPLKNPSMKRLIKKLSTEGKIGIHPSYYSNRNSDLILEEKKEVVAITNIPVTISRQHYIKNRIPHTYNALLAKGISDDYSMGYATHLGFRAGTGKSFSWYNLNEEKRTGLRIHSFCFMDTAAKYDCALSPREAFTKLEKMKTALQKNQSTLITVFHNFSLGTSAEWSGWKEEYEKFLQSATAIS